MRALLVSFTLLMLPLVAVSGISERGSAREFVQDAKPKEIEWTHDLAKMSFPAEAASGKILGKSFKVEATKMDITGALTLRQGKGFFPDQAIIIFLKEKSAAALAGKSYEISTDTAANERPHIHLQRMNPGEKVPKGVPFINGYAMKLEFGTAKKGVIPGKIYVCMPDDEKTVVAGTFTVK